MTDEQKDEVAECIESNLGSPLTGLVAVLKEQFNLTEYEVFCEIQHSVIKSIKGEF